MIAGRRLRYLARGITMYRRDGLLHHPLWAAGTIVHFWDPKVEYSCGLVLRCKVIRKRRGHVMSRCLIMTFNPSHIRRGINEFRDTQLSFRPSDHSGLTTPYRAYLNQRRSRVDCVTEKGQDGP